MKTFLFFLLSLSTCVFPQVQYDVEKYLDNISVSDICGTPENLWVSTNNDGIYNFEFKTGKLHHYSSSEGSIDQDFFYSIDMNDNFVWAGSADGLFTFNKRRGRWQKRKFGKGGQMGNWIRAIKYDKSANCVWIGRFQYLTKLDLSRRRFYDYDLTVKNDSKSNSIKSIRLEGKNTVWFGSEGGLHKYNKLKNIEDKSAITFYDNSLNYFQGEGDKVSISSIYSGKDYLWIGVDEFKSNENPNFNVGGLYKFDRNFKWERIDIFDGLAGNGINSIENTGSYLWVALYTFSNSSNNSEKYGRGLALISLSDYSIRMIDDPRVPQSINKIFYDGKDLWLGAEDGLYKINMSNKFADFN